MGETIKTLQSTLSKWEGKMKIVRAKSTFFEKQLKNTNFKLNIQNKRNPKLLKEHQVNAKL